MIVLDASVAVKWYLAEQGSDAAIDLLIAHNTAIRAPDIFAVEVVATLVREANVEKRNAEAVQAALARFETLCDSNAIDLVRATPSALRGSAALAIVLGHPLKDCLYLALAIELGCPLVTADVRFAARTARFYENVQILGALPRG